MASAASPGAISAVAHELRTPIAAVRAAASALRSANVDPETTARLLGVIEDSAAQLARLVDDLLVAGRLDAGMLPVEIVRCAVDELALAAAEAAKVSRGDSTIRVEGHAVALADPQRLRQAVTNLIENALRHSPPGGAVDVSIEHDRERGRVRLSVRDRGPGIPARDRERIFEPFVRLGETGSGTGLGLYIARGLVRAMSGELALEPPAEPTPGAGATFTIVLPAAGAA